MGSSMSFRHAYKTSSETYEFSKENKYESDMVYSNDDYCCVQLYLALSFYFRLNQSFKKIQYHAYKLICGKDTNTILKWWK